MGYIWNPNLETGYEKVDEQHKQLFTALNDIADAFQEGRGSEEIFSTLEFLAGYTAMHFSAEEEVMQKYEYPNYTVHKQSHDNFKITVAELFKRLRDEGSSEDLIVNVTATIGDWLISHIRVDDIKMTSFIEQHGGTF